MSEPWFGIMVFHYKPTGEVCVGRNAIHEEAPIRLQPKAARELARRILREADAVECKTEPEHKAGFLAWIRRPS